MTVPVEVSPGQRVAGAIATDLTWLLATVNEISLLTVEPEREAVIVTLPAAAPHLAEAVKPHELLPDGTVTVAGTVTSALELVRLTVAAKAEIEVRYTSPDFVPPSLRVRPLGNSIRSTFCARAGGGAARETARTSATIPRARPPSLTRCARCDGRC